MRRRLSSGLTYALARANLFPTRMTDADALRALVGRLHPLATDKALVRLGPSGDGGYLVPDDLAGISACFSPGVNVVAGFEMACAERGMRVFLADASVDRPPEEHERFHFSKRFVGATTNREFVTLDDWVDASPAEHGSDLLLQVDIEGYEYEVFLSATNALMRRFRIIVAEFHGLDQLWSRPFFSLAGRAFEKILETHSCVHLHPNNCCGSVTLAGMEIPTTMEFSFLRNDRIGARTFASAFPHPLDADNTARPSLPLPRCWYRGE